MLTIHVEKIYFENLNISVFRNHGNISTLHILRIQGLRTIL